jgi:excisionase family DNA binding protein
MSDRLLTVDELAEYLRVDRSTVYRFIRDGELPYVTVGTRVRFRRIDIEMYLERQAGTLRLPKSLMK